MGRNAALMCQAVAKATGYVAEIGMDLDVEGAVSMPHIGDFVNAYRKQAPYGSPFPLMMWYVLCVDNCVAFAVVVVVVSWRLVLRVVLAVCLPLMFCWTQRAVWPRGPNQRRTFQGAYPPEVWAGRERDPVRQLLGREHAGVLHRYEQVLAGPGARLHP